MDDGSAPFFSVVIPLYNRRNEVVTAIESVLRQTCQNFEIIVVDDGSTDDPSSAIEGIADTRIRFLRQSNSGGSAARNLGIDHAKGEYIAFLDSDDVFLPEKLETMHQEINAHAPAWLASYCRVDRGRVFARRPQRPPHPEERIDDFLFAVGEPLQTSTLVVRTDVAQEIRFDPALRKGEDPDFVLRMWRRFPSFAFVPSELAIWNDSTENNRLSSSRNARPYFDWLSANETKLSARAFHGFRANVLSFELAPTEPLRALTYIAEALCNRSISLRRAVHSAARAIVPRTAYRRIIDVALRWRPIGSS